MLNDINQSLLIKYDQAVPRYTSYPTAPEWYMLDKEIWSANLKKLAQEEQEISLYFHLPFCRSACYYCACNVVVDPQRKMVGAYLHALKNEMKSVRQFAGKKLSVKQLHFGGGTPTYLNSAELIELCTAIEENFTVDKSPDSEISIEIDPRVTSLEQLKILRGFGFNRVSLGVQDFDETVQKAVNRLQSYELVKNLVEGSRELGFESVNFDLIYGLPFQTVKSFENTLHKVIELSPDRVALFNYAHLPTMRPFQKAYILENTLPNKEEKINTFLKALEIFTGNEYLYVGLDHFAKCTDELAIALENQTLHRNFQGYTTKAGLPLIGLGITSIGYFPDLYYQNTKSLPLYLDHYREVNEQPIVEKGFEMSLDDKLRAEIIRRILCQGRVDFKQIEQKYNLSFQEYFALEIGELSGFVEDQLLVVDSEKIVVTSLGRIFLRNIAKTFDAYLRSGKGKKLFSRSI